MHFKKKLWQTYGFENRILIVGGNFLHMAAPAGKYSRSFELNAVPDPSCDPSKQPCEQWIPGQYDVKLSKYRS